MTSPSREIAWRFGKRVALSGFWSETFAHQIEPHYREWAEEEIAKFLRERKP